MVVYLITNGPAGIPLWFDMQNGNHSDKTLTAEQMLETYKEQGMVERGFRFLKDPRFELNHVFLQKPARIEALMMVMTLCLLVSNLGEYTIRKGLKETEQTVTDQKKN